MGRTDATITREKILKAAEDCFSAGGFDGTGIEKVSEAAGVNKSLIYYHFKNKEGLLLALYEQVIGEIKILVNQSFKQSSSDMPNAMIPSLRGILGFLKKKRNLMKILMMEALKGGESNRVFLEMAEYVMKDELGQLTGEEHEKFQDNPSYFLIYEFFTGFMPIYSYAVFSDNWPEYFGIDNEKMEEYFMESFMKSHLSHHH